MYELKACIFTSTSLLAGLLFFQYCADRRLVNTIGKRLPVLLLCTQIAAFMSPDVVIYNVIIGCGLVFACAERRMIAPAYLFLLVTVPVVPKLIAAGGTYIMMYDASISLSVGALIALAVRSKGQFSRTSAWDIPVFLLFVIYVLINARSTTATNTMRVLLEQGATVLLPYYVTSRSMRSFDDLRAGLYGLVAGVMAMSTLAIYEALHTWPLYRVVSDHYGLMLDGGASVKMRAGFLRSSGPYTEPTSFSYCLALGMLAAIGCRQLFASKSKRTLALLLLTLGILAPQSRGGWMGVGIGLVAMELYDQRLGQLGKKVGITLAAALAVFAVAQVNQKVASVAGLTAEGQGTVDYRSSLLDRGIEEVRAHPVFGRSPADVRIAMRDLMQGEGIIDFVNTYLFVALTSGVVGLLLFVGVFVTPLQALWTAKASIPRRHLAMFRRSSSGSLVFGSLMSVMLMIAVTSMTGRTTTLAIVEIGFASVIMNNMRVARRAMRQAEQSNGNVAEAPIMSHPLAA